MKSKTNEFVTGIIVAGVNTPTENVIPAIEIKEEISTRTLYNLIRLFCSQIIISANCPKSYHYLNEKTFADEVKGTGAIGTIYSALKKSSSRKNLILSCDMPLIPAGLLLLLMERKEWAEFIVPASGSNTIEPLCAIYDKALIPILSEMIKKGDHNMNNLPRYCRTELVQVYNGNNIFMNRSINRHPIEKR